MYVLDAIFVKCAMTNGVSPLELKEVNKSKILKFDFEGIQMKEIITPPFRSTSEAAPP